MTVWQGKTLLESMGAIGKSAKANLDSLRAEMSMVQGELNRMSASVSKGSELGAMAASATADAASSGIYFIKLAPEQGAWTDRISTAAGAPPMDPSAYTAVICNLAISPDLSSVEGAASAIETASSTVIPEAKAFFSLPNPPALPASVELPVIPDPVPPPQNEWTSITLADAFPSLKAELDQKLEAGLKKQQAAESALTGLQQKLDELQSQVAEAQAFYDSLKGTGVFAIALEPEETPSADWYSRLTTPTGAEGEEMPSTDPNNYCSGTITVLVAANYQDLIEKFNNFKLKGA